MYYSNRSAAHAALKRWDEALRDGKRSAALKPGWAKGFVRIGAAYFGMELWCEVRTEISWLQLCPRIHTHGRDDIDEWYTIEQR